MFVEIIVVFKIEKRNVLYSVDETRHRLRLHTCQVKQRILNFSTDSIVKMMVVIQ